MYRLYILFWAEDLADKRNVHFSKLSGIDSDTVEEITAVQTSHAETN